MNVAANAALAQTFQRLMDCRIFAWRGAEGDKVAVHFVAFSSHLGSCRKKLFQPFRGKVRIPELALTVRGF